MQGNKQFEGFWAVILGGSSGFGLAAAEKLAAHGMNIAVLYRETAAAEKPVKLHFEQIAEANEVTILPFNINALEVNGRQKFMETFTEKVNAGNCVKLLLHSVARGNLKPVVAADKKETITTEDIAYTSYAMGNSLLDWARLLFEANLFCEDARIIGLTSAGAHKYWESYAAVSIAKASLQSLATYMAVEFGKQGIKTNLIQAGITETPSLKKIAGNDKLMQHAKQSNPLGRMTTTKDVANVIYLLCMPEASWINGAVIHVDGGEHCL
ncbi:SDR family oxidoreductase [Parafilimonas terrae]|uniref:NAD(P)-dependent dehydrogenase, short-chain alcohol dehydrogenase family n=1 Tax=Parafilimonas terrae TaxID=1465490 RepID=A0A1I5XXV3_9BACT|nr:SDR family oxidoreductase [Parafilimonas terrae]SFQ36783.1 NAD(P)-dependent dehydrogenase, short-chain alcohol dehydrogenase family [Parafilimonas terrae]